MDALDGALAAAVEDLRDRAEGRPSIGRLTLRGRGPLARDLRKARAVADLLERARETGMAEEPFLWLEKIVLRCLPEVDLARRREVDDFLGQVLKVGRDTLAQIPPEGGPGDVPGELSAVFDDLYGHRKVSRLLPALTPEALRELLGEAELLCLDLQEPGE